MDSASQSEGSGGVLDLPHNASEAPVNRVVLLIGPEGGWNDFELGHIAAAGFVFAQIGAVHTILC